jgi:hypothetical protein
VRIFDAVVLDRELFLLLAAYQSLLFSDLLCHIDCDVTETFELARESAVVDEMSRAYQRQLF